MVCDVFEVLLLVPLESSDMEGFGDRGAVWKEFKELVKEASGEFIVGMIMENATGARREYHDAKLPSHMI